MFFSDWGGESLLVLPPSDNFVAFGVRVGGFLVAASDRALSASLFSVA
jgi:hypothetical protein